MSRTRHRSSDTSFWRHHTGYHYSVCQAWTLSTPYMENMADAYIKNVEEHTWWTGFRMWWRLTCTGKYFYLPDVDRIKVFPGAWSSRLPAPRRRRAVGGPRSASRPESLNLPTTDSILTTMTQSLRTATMPRLRYPSLMTQIIMNLQNIDTMYRYIIMKQIMHFP